VEKKIYDFQQVAVLSDMEVIAFSYRPIQAPNAHNLIKRMMRQEPYYYEINDPGPINRFNSLLTNEPLELTPINELLSKVRKEGGEQDSFSRSTRKKNSRTRVISRLDTNLSNQLDESDFLRNVTKGNTLLGLASFEHPPKPVF
jgi:hypothetical protein